MAGSGTVVLWSCVLAEVNSKARADAIRKKIEKALGAGVRYRASEIQSLDKMLADRRETGGAAVEESKRLAQLPEVREKISEMMAAHWEHWVSQPLPIAGNRTPMDAVKDPDGRQNQAAVGDGDTVGVARKIAPDFLRSPNGCLA
jgi:hypothetical protein